MTSISLRRNFPSEPKTPCSGLHNVMICLNTFSPLWVHQRVIDLTNTAKHFTAKEFSNESLAKQSSAPLANSGAASTAPARPATPRHIPQTTACQGHQIASSQSTRTPALSAQVPHNRKASSPSGAFFSTVLSSSASSDKMGFNMPPPSHPLSTQQCMPGQQSQSYRQPDPYKGSVPMSAKRKGKMRACDSTS